MIAKEHMFGLGVQELLIILLIILVLFGGKKLPELAKSLAESLKIFQHTMEGVESTSKKKNKTSPADSQQRQTASEDDTSSSD